jgi:phosphoglycerate dehydrogenase-like enzyme
MWFSPLVDTSIRLRIVVCCTGYPDASSTSELTWALILAAVRNLPAETRYVREGGWQMNVGTMLEGKVLGLLGLGRLGSRVAKVGQAFGMETIAWSQKPHRREGRGTRCGRGEQAGAVLQVQRAVRSSDAQRPQPRPRRGGRAFSMKPTALLVNTSRGPIVDEDALVRVLQERKIGGAALDVFDVEPLPKDHPLRGLDNVVVTPHIGYVTEGNYRVFYQEAVENIAAFVADKPIRVIE